MTYYIRTYAVLLPEHFQEPRTQETVRRSLNGELCVVAFEPGMEPKDWADGMTQEKIVQLLNAPESSGIWYNPEIT